MVNALKRSEITSMTPAQATEIVRWQYPSPYEFYNTPESALDESLKEIIDDNGMDYYAVLDESGALFGMYEYSFPEGFIEIERVNRTSYGNPVTFIVMAIVDIIHLRKTGIKGQEGTKVIFQKDGRSNER